MMENLERIIALMKQVDFLEDQAAHAQELKEHLYGKDLIISVIGQFKRGKSSLINALLGEDLLPVGIIPLTTAVTEIRCGTEFCARVILNNGQELEVSREELADYISEQKNPGNHKQVQAVRIWMEHGPFEEGITLVDTPGVGSVHQHNTKTSLEYIEKSDAVLFLLSVDSPVSETERDFLLKARNYAAKFYFAVNKTDTVSQENLEEFLGYCNEILTNILGQAVSLYPVSAKEGTGVRTLAIQLRNDLKGSYQELLESSVSIKLNEVLVQARARLLLFLKAAAIPAQELEQKISQIREKQNSLQSLTEEVQVLTRRRTDKLIDHIKEQLEEILNDKIRDLKEKAEVLYQDFESLSSLQFESIFTVELESLLRSSITECNEVGLKLLSEGYQDIVDSLNRKAEDTSRYISELVQMYFGTEYPLNSRTYTVSGKNDNFTRLTLYYDTSMLVHLLPRKMANSRIYTRLLKKAVNDLEKNTSGILYNYRYKMQESLRSLGVQFTQDITRMNQELSSLLDYVSQGHEEKKEELHRTERKIQLLLTQLEDQKGRKERYAVE